MSRVNISEVLSSDDTPIPLFPNVLDDIDNSFTYSALLFLGLTPYEVVPSLRDGGVESAGVLSGVILVPCLNPVPDEGGRGAIFAEVDGGLWRK
jgi:hypothetical protein